MLNKSLYFLLVCSLLLCCVCCSGPSRSDSPERYTLFDISYEVPASWSSTVTSETDPDAAACSNMHTDVRDGVDLAVDRYTADSLGWCYVEDDPDLSDEVLFPCDYQVGSAEIPGSYYKSDEGFFVYMYEITFEPAYYRLTFTLQKNDDRHLAEMHAVLDSLKAVD